MPIHNNSTQFTAATSAPSSLGGNQTPSSSIKNRVEGVAFNALFSKEPETEQLRFKLTETKKTGSSYYTIVTWKGKRYRITVHENKRQQAYSVADWQKVEHRTIKVLDKVQNSQHFFRGTLALHARTKNKWKVTHENNSPHVERSVNKRVIREFKKLFEDQIKPTSILPSQSPKKRTSYSPYSPSNTIYKPEKKEGTSFPKKLIEKVKNFLYYLKSNTNKDMEEIERKKGLFEQAKEYLFPSSSHDHFNDLASSEAASINSFEELDNREDDLTSLGGSRIAPSLSHVSRDSGSSYSPEVSPEKK